MKESPVLPAENVKRGMFSNLLKNEENFCFVLRLSVGDRASALERDGGQRAS
jgi:hypothetical protein